MRVTELVKLEKLIDEGKTKEEIIEAMKPRQRNGNNKPDGGISLREAERKYGISSNTIRGWIEKKLIKTIPSDRREVYVNELLISKISKKYKARKGRGNRAIIEILRVCTNN